MKSNNIPKWLFHLNKRLLTTFVLIVAVISSLSCVDSANDKQVITVNPFGVGIIVFNSIPSQLWGNGTDIDPIKINTGLIPDGSEITARITNSTLDDELSGCVTSASSTVQNGMATLNFLAPIFIGNQGETQQVNLAVTIETPDGTKINDFVTLTILAVGITAPDDSTINSPDEFEQDMPFLNLEFVTFGFEPGTEAQCSVGNPALGTISMGPYTVVGTKAQGEIIVQYFPAFGPGIQSGINSVTCSIVMPNPNSVDDDCNNVSESDRTASATTNIDQGASPDIQNPPQPNSVTCTPNPITGGNEGFCTCNNTNAAGQEICFDASPGSDLSFPGGGCVDANVSGTAQIPFDTDVVTEQVVEQVTCSPTGSAFFVQTNVTINPGQVNSLTCVPNPVSTDMLGGDPTEIVCTCSSSDSPLTEVCLEEVLDPDDLLTIPSPPACTETDANGNALFFPTVDPATMNTEAQLECCLNVDDDDTCDNNVTVQHTLDINTFVPPVTSISCNAQNNTLGGGQSTLIDIETEGLAVGFDEVCVDIPINSEAPNSASSIPTACSVIDANGNASIQFDAGATVVVEQDVTVRCFVDNVDTGDTFTPGEIADFDTITLDPAAGPAPIEVACSPFPVSIAPGGNSLITATLMNAVPGTPVCFEFFSNTSPDSDLSDDDEPAPDTLVCSTTNLANQAFATLESNSLIMVKQNANILCCADTGTTNSDCEPDDPQAITAVEVNPVPPALFMLTIQADDLTPPDGDNEDIDVFTTPAVPAGTTICLFKTFDDTGDDNNLDGDTAPEVDGIGETTCTQMPDGTGVLNNDFRLEISGSADDDEQIIVQGCIDLDGDDNINACDPGEPLSNTLTFTIDESSP